MAVAVNALQVADKFLHVVDVIVEVESAVGQGHGARVLPVGDVDLVVLEHGFDGVAQQGGVMARQGRDDQHGRLALEPGQRGRVVGKTLEAAQLAKRLVNFNPLMNGDVGAANIHRLDIKGRFFVVLA